MKRLKLCLSSFILFTAQSAFALPDDRDQPIHIQADKAELDDRKGVALYSGNVVITQGSMQITGEHATMTRGADGGVDIFTATGKPATFRQQPEVNKEVVKAYGLTIQYFAVKDQVLLLDQAKVVQGNSTFEGEKIVYDSARQIVNAGRASGQKITVPRPRIDMVIEPKQNAGQGNNP